MSERDPDQKANNKGERHPAPVLLPAAPDWDPAKDLRLQPERNPLPDGTLGEIGIYAQVTGRDEFPETILKLPYDPEGVMGIDPASIRVFRWDARLRNLRPVWNSGINPRFSYIWAKLRRPGVYVALGLPRDRLAQEVLRVMAHTRRYSDAETDKAMHAITEEAIELLLKTPEDDLEELRRILALTELQTSLTGFADPQVQLGIGGHPKPFPLPGNVDLKAFKERLAKLRTPPGGLPEEALFFRPELDDVGRPPFPHPPTPRGWDPDSDICPPLPRPWPPEFPPFPIPWPRPRLPLPLPRPFCWLFSRNWWMYHHDERHTGVASGCSNIRSTNVGTMSLLNPATALDGTIVSIPTVVGGKVYIGTANIPGTGPGGKLYRIDLASGAIDLPAFAVATRTPAYFQGIGGSPAVVGGKVYFTAIPGRVYCLDANTFSLLWMTDLRDPDPAHNQPVRNNIGFSYKADSWSSPLVVNGKVYVGSGEGEDPQTYGFVFCLDANTGNVIWLFCTNKFVAPANNAPPHNSPNVIPREVSISDPLPAWAVAAGFSLHPNPVPETGSSVWSSCAYDYTLNRIYVGTGNSKYVWTEPGGGADLPDEMYGSGMLALDADTGEFRGFHQPGSDDSYRPGDSDVDVPGSALIFSRGGQRVVAYGSKNGSFFLLDAATMQVLGGGGQRRQLLPVQGGTGLPGDRGTPIPGFADAFENQWGMYATPAIHAGLGKLYVGLGGRGSVPDPSKTPFVRALDWNTLLDAWPHAVDPTDNVIKYTTARPPLYTSSEVGLSSPAVVNDVVFVSTNKAALYALDASTGLCLWPAPGLPVGNQALGPAVYGNYVILGCGSNLFRYTL